MKDAAELSASTGASSTRYSLPNLLASRVSLTSQRFWDHMDRLNQDSIDKIWEDISRVVVENEDVDMSSVHIDGTNFYTFIDTFNTRCDIPQNGRNKQKRSDLRQVNYSVFCSESHQIPLYFDVYDGNCNDYTQFPLVIQKFQKHLRNKDLSDSTAAGRRDCQSPILIWSPFEIARPANGPAASSTAAWTKNLPPISD